MAAKRRTGAGPRRTVLGAGGPAAAARRRLG